MAAGNYVWAAPFLKKVVAQYYHDPQGYPIGPTITQVKLWLGKTMVYQGDNPREIELYLQDLLNGQLLHWQRARASYYLACVLTCSHDMARLQEAKRLCEYAASIHV